MLKKIVLFMAICAVSFRLSAQISYQSDKWFDFQNNGQLLSVGLNIGVAGYNTEYQDLGFGISASLLGIYVDFLIAPPEHEYNNHISNIYWEDDQAWTLNLGYQIPVRHWLRITPLLGYSQTSYGVTDGSTINIHSDGESSASISHDYIPYEKFHEFNFGGALSVRPLGWLEITGTFTRRAIYGGIAVDLGQLADKF